MTHHPFQRLLFGMVISLFVRGMATSSSEGENWACGSR